ncbi:VTT domain-containing protein [Nesterenkonia sp.]|uniref:VTT domain-containing protein n=1 Tax=Nesterenkonia sp. TaxID=704201 RepID=UPI00262577A1|nr:VTT domain-containing protein [Nesterenkonia sp.]
MDWLSELTSSPALPHWALLLSLLVVMAIPMGPAEPTALAAAALVSTAALPPLTTVVAIAAGMTLGDALTHRAAGPLLRRMRQKPHAAGRLHKWSQRLQRQRYGRDAAVAGLRLLPGARTPAALAARAAGISSPRFLLLAAAGSLIWAALWVLGGGTLLHTLPTWAAAAGVAAALLAGLTVPVRRRVREQRLSCGGRSAGVVGRPLPAR